MMTLKHIDADGHETVVTVVSVSFDPETKIVWGHGTPSGGQQWTSGRVFVMNELGKTVADYKLNKEQHA